MKVKPQLVQLWTKILEKLPPPTQPLVKDHFTLIEFDIEKNIATLSISNQHLLPFAKKRQPDLESAFSVVLKETIKVQFSIGEKAHLSPTEILQQQIQKEKGLKLTDGQAIALSKIISFLKNDSHRSFLLKGYAGTGKTFLTELILDYCQKNDLNVILAAPTNKAAKVLSQTTDQNAITIARMLGIRPKINKDTGKEVYYPDPKANSPNLDSFDLVILDETSMIGDDLFKLIAQRITLLSPKFLFLGDPAQLPPVGEIFSPVFSQVEATAQLTKVVRYSGAILNYATALRSQSVIVPVRDYIDHKTLQIFNHHQFNEAVLSAFNSKAFKKNPNSCRVLAWTNARVAYWNQQIRSGIYGDQAPRFLPGERLVATSACTERTDEQNGDERQEVVILPSSGEILVIEADEKKGIVEYAPFRRDEFSYWGVKGIDEEDNEKTFRILARSEEKRYQSMLKDYFQRKNWDCYWGLKRAFHPLQYAYALTVHRSQGSTFNRVFLDEKNLLRNSNPKEKQQLLYTAVTRASEQLGVLG